MSENQYRPLYSRYSGERGDTRLQTFNDWEDMYDGNEYMIGQIWSEPGPDRVPLYGAYSDQKQDTRVQVGRHFEPSYKQSPYLLGYILTGAPDHQKPGLVGLYSRFNPFRLDSRLRTFRGNHNWESGYDLQEFPEEFLGFIKKPWKVYLSDIIVDFGDPDPDVPPIIHVDEYTNESDIEQEKSFSFTTRKGTSATLEWSSETKLGLEVSGKVGIPLVAEGEVKATVEETVTVGQAKTASSDEELTETVPVTVPPRTHARCVFKQQRGATTATFTAKMTLVDDEGNKTRWNETGTYKCDDFSAKVDTSVTTEKLSD